MSYSYLKSDKLRDLESIKKKFGENSFEFLAVDFIRNKCEKLRFDVSKENEKDNPKSFTGKSTKAGQIPYNMEKDLDRYTFENSIINFLYTGKKEDAYNIFYCFLEMFIGDYSRTESMVELLSEYESNGSRLLMKHRDHYSHSAFVFVLGLAIYNSNKKFSDTYNSLYNVNGCEAANHFLEYWGLTSLFHDVGYPFELPFEQLESYFEVDNKKRHEAPFLSYSNLDSLIKIDRKIARRINDIYKDDIYAVFENTNELFAYAITERLAKTYYFTKEQMTRILSKKPCNPDEYNYYMDHAYFSANLVFQKLFANIDDTSKFTMEHIDAMTAIILHNSLYKFSVADYNNPNINIPLKPELHPLAYLLMLCDELQCWDRTAYGRMSTKELHPVDVNITFDEDKINASYIFDMSKNKGKIENYKVKYIKWIENEPDKNEKDEIENEGKTKIEIWHEGRPKLKSFASFYEGNLELDLDKNEKIFNKRKYKLNNKKSKFQGDIERIVDTKSIILDVTIEDEKVASQIISDFNEFSTGYLSDSNFTNMNNFAEILNYAYSIDIDETESLLNKMNDKNTLSEIKSKFNDLSLEYKIFNINKAKAFPGFLEKINCFYTNKVVSNSEVTDFYKEEIEKLALLSHKRWLIEKYQMGWRYGKPKDEKEKYKNRIHDELIDNYTFDSYGDVYGEKRLSFNEKVKTNFELLNKITDGNYFKRELKHINLILPLLKQYEGTGIYCLKKRGENGYIEDDTLNGIS